MKSQTDGPQVVHKEIREIVVVFFRVEICTLILRRCPYDVPGNREVFKNPISTAKQIPVKQRSGGSTVAIYKRMVIRQPKVEHDCLENGWNPRRIIIRTGELAKSFNSRLKLRRWRRRMNDVIAIIDVHIIARSKSAC